MNDPDDYKKFYKLFAVREWEFDPYEVMRDAEEILEKAVETATKKVLDNVQGQVRKLQEDAATLGIVESVGKVEIEFVGGYVVMNFGENWDYKVKTSIVAMAKEFVDLNGSDDPSADALRAALTEALAILSTGDSENG